MTTTKKTPTKRAHHTREQAIAEAIAKGWEIQPLRGAETMLGWAVDPDGITWHISFEWRNHTRYTFAEGAGDNYWWVMA